MNEDWDDFLRFTSELGIDLDQNQLKKFKVYYQLLLDWNQRLNLVSRKDVHRILGYHFVDSLACLPLIPPGGAVCDLGTGAGLPGIPIKIVRDGLTLYLVESIQKKCRFLESAIADLGLKNTFVLNQRAEALTGLKVDIVSARLLGAVKDILPLGFPLLRHGGRFLIYKSAAADEELKEAKAVLSRLKGHVEKVETVVLPGSGISRKIISIIKS